MSVDAVFKFAASTIPGIMILGGILMQVFGYPCRFLAIINSYPLPPP